jgi:phosphoribosylformimino-5-aminoimidazole carboxamide ribotide isomerase
MDLYPAIDIREGSAVRLAQGDFDRQRGYGDPVELATRFAAAGAPWLHVVDLDAARSGRPVNREIVLAIARAVPTNVQSGGGVRSREDAEALLGGGVARVVLGTAAVESPGLAREVAASFPGRVAVGLDYRASAEGRPELAIRGWEKGTGRAVADVLAELADAGLAAVVLTAIERDGMLSGPDLDGAAEALAATALPVIASGGVSSVHDLEALAAIEVPAKDGGADRRVSGAITGRALVEGKLTVEEGVAVCARSG